VTCSPPSGRGPTRSRSGWEPARLLEVEKQITLNNEFHAQIARAADSPRLLEALEGTAGIPIEFRAVF
jgi:DNA-binding GntR family transcriptional regulator